MTPTCLAAAGRLARNVRVLALVAFAIAPLACTHRAAPPSAEAPQQRPVNLTGLPVMVLPAQPTPSTSESLAREFDSELAYWLTDRAPRVKWIPASELERLAKTSPALRMDLHTLDVRSFGRMRVERIGDPLFGDIHNLGAVVDARLALLPATLAFVTASDSSHARTSAGTGRIEVTAALIETFTGDVVWYGVVAGDPGPIDAPGAVASAAQALARALTPGN